MSSQLVSVQVDQLVPNFSGRISKQIEEGGISIEIGDFFNAHPYFKGGG